MAGFTDTAERYGTVTRALHWGMAALFAAQFFSAGIRVLLPREHPFRELVWSYHSTLGATLFLLVILRGFWGLAMVPRRPGHRGPFGRVAVAGHLALYGLMVIVPSLRLIAAAGSTGGFSYLGIQIFPPRETEIAWMRAMAEYHGELGWLLFLLVLGHIGFAVVWHHLIRRDGTLGRMAG